MERGAHKNWNISHPPSSSSPILYCQSFFQKDFLLCECGEERRESAKGREGEESTWILPRRR